MQFTMILIRVCKKFKIILIIFLFFIKKVMLKYLIKTFILILNFAKCHDRTVKQHFFQSNDIIEALVFYLKPEESNL